MTRPQKRTLPAAMLLAGISLLAALAGSFAFPRVCAAASVSCDIQRGPCSATTADGTSIELDILPRPVTVMTELRFIVTLARNGRPVTDAVVTLDLSMPGMYMGRNRPVLRPAANGRYEGTGVILRCPSGKKMWQARISATAANRTGKAAFVFEVR